MKFHAYYCDKKFKIKITYIYLQFFFRSGFHSLEIISSTDNLCTWKKAAQTTAEKLYSPMPIMQFECHCMPKPQLNIQKTRNFQKMSIVASKDCALAKHLQRQSNSNKNRSGCIFNEELFNIEILLIDVASTNPIFEQVNGPLCWEDVELADSQDSIRLLKETKQNKLLWQKNRYHHITGTKAHRLLVYRHVDWHSRIVKVMMDTFKVQLI